MTWEFIAALVCVTGGFLAVLYTLVKLNERWIDVEDEIHRLGNEICDLRKDVKGADDGKVH